MPYTRSGGRCFDQKSGSIGRNIEKCCFEVSKTLLSPPQRAEKLLKQADTTAVQVPTGWSSSSLLMRSVELENGRK